MDNTQDPNNPNTNPPVGTPQPVTTPPANPLAPPAWPDMSVPPALTPEPNLNTPPIIPPPTQWPDMSSPTQTGILINTPPPAQQPNDAPIPPLPPVPEFSAVPTPEPVAPTPIIPSLEPTPMPPVAPDISTTPVVPTLETPQSLPIQEIPPMPAPEPTPLQSPALDAALLNPTPSTTPISDPISMMQTPVDNAPTDLSHLITPQQTIDNSPYTPPLTSQPDTLIVPPSTTGATITIPNNEQTPDEGHKIPKWVFGLAAGLLLIVIGVSAYFILGIGQNTETTEPPTSVPAVQAPRSETIPTLGTQPSNSDENPSDTSFGDISEPSPAPTLAPSSTPTSAADLIRARQQTSPSPSPLTP